MREVQQKRKVRQILYSNWVLVTLLVITVIVVRASWNVYMKEVTSARYVANAQDSLDKVTADEAQLKNAVDALNTQEGLEAEIRRKFMVVKPGEQIAVIIDKSPTATSSSQPAPAKTWWDKVSGLFQ